MRRSVFAFFVLLAGAGVSVARAQESYDLGTLSWRRLDASGTPAETLARARPALAS